MKIKCFLALAVGFGAPNIRAQQLTPVWEYLVNAPGVPIAVLTNAVNDTTDNDNGDGHAVMDSMEALKR